MDFNQFENLLGKHISITEKFIGDDFDNKLFNKNYYYIIDESIKKDFYGMLYNTISIQTNEKEKVQSITIRFNEVINGEFYNSFILDYGKPNSIQVVENKKIIRDSIHESKNFTQHLTRSSFELREGTLEEKPLFVLWNKKEYQIKAFLRHKSNISEITFSILGNQ